MKSINKALYISVVCLGLICFGCKKTELRTQDSAKMVAIMDNMLEAIKESPISPDPDNTFAIVMRILNQGAINMAKAEMQLGSNVRMKTVAEKNITDQTAEITQFSSFLDSHISHSNLPEFNQEVMLDINRAGKMFDLQDITGDIDHDFALLMIAHHTSTIENARLELLYGDDPAMKALAKALILRQEQEIRYLQAWLIGNKNPD